MQNVIFYTVYPVNKFNNVQGHISLVRALSSFAGICIASTIFNFCYTHANVHTPYMAIPRGKR